MLKWVGHLIKMSWPIGVTEMPNSWISCLRQVLSWYIIIIIMPAFIRLDVSTNEISSLFSLWNIIRLIFFLFLFDYLFYWIIVFYPVLFQIDVLLLSKKVCRMFGGFRKTLYLCNRKRETNAPHWGKRESSVSG